MPVAGLVLTLVDDDALCAFAIDNLRAIPGVSLGELQRARKLPIATVVDSIEAQTALWQDLSRVPGVLLVDLVFEDFSDVEAGSFSSDDLPSKWRRRRDDGEQHSFNEFSGTEEQV
jgi:hypothetical protein